MSNETQTRTDATSNAAEEELTPEEAAAFAAVKREAQARRGQPRFSLGQMVSTRGALEDLDGSDILLALRRHINGDWGDICREDWEENEFSLQKGYRLFSVYHSANGVKFYVITEWNRSVTTVLLPDEY